MPATSDELTVARSWIGSVAAESDIVFNERYDRLGSLDLAIEESLRSQLAIFNEPPAFLRLPSGLQVDFSSNIKLLQDQLKIFLATGGTTGGIPAISRLVRPDYR